MTSSPNNNNDRRSSQGSSRRFFAGASIYNKPSDSDGDIPLPFNSRNSPFLCTKGCVATSQPLASSIGLQILLKGGNAADSALATAAALAVLEPCSTGLGGDMFSLYYDAQSKQVSAINASGICPAHLNLDLLKQRIPDTSSTTTTGIDVDAFEKSVYSITTPAAARGWEDFYIKYTSKKFTFAELLEPAAQLAEHGFPVSIITSHFWKAGLEKDIKKWYTQEEKEEIKSDDDNVVNNFNNIHIHIPLSMNGTGEAPKPGDIMTNIEMAKVLRSLGKHGATNGFYKSFPGKAIVKTIQKHGGVMTQHDLNEEHTKSTFPEPIFAEYNGVKLYQVPPNGQGIAGLIALSGLGSLEEQGIIPKPQVHKNGSGWASAQTWHAMIEMMRLGFGDARAFECDTEFCNNNANGKADDGMKYNEFLMDQERIKQRAQRLFDPNRAVVQGIPDPTSGTVSFQVVDEEGNAVSFVNSNYAGFGTGLVPEGCGFTLQNRGFGFSLDPNHLNALEPYKRPFHTIIPGMITHADTNELYATMSNMGGWMQPQGHMQLTVGMVSAGLNPQAAIDLPRFSIADGTHDGVVLIEQGPEDEIIDELISMKHNMQNNISGYERTIFGKAQIIKKDRKTGLLWAGSDGRADGCAMGY